MIIGATTVARIIAMLPPGVVKTTYVLGSRKTRETGYTDVSWGFARMVNVALRYSVNDSETLLQGAIAGEMWREFELFKTTETVDPKSGDKLTDDDGVVWQVKRVIPTMMKLIFKLLCLKNK